MTGKLTQERSVRAGCAPFDSRRSPCTLDCRTFPWLGKSYCRGCLRTTEEIREWRTMSDEKYEEMWEILRERAEKLRG
jgi:uncharacterized protein